MLRRDQDEQRGKRAKKKASEPPQQPTTSLRLSQSDFPDTNGLQVLWASAPTGHPYVSPGHRPGKAPRKIIQPRRGGTRFHHQETLKRQRLSPIRAAPLGPPRWGSVGIRWLFPRPLAWADIGLPLWGEIQHLQFVSVRIFPRLSKGLSHHLFVGRAT